MKKQLNASVIGLGSMGWGAASSLLEAGFDTTGIDIQQAAVDKFIELGGKAVTRCCDGVREAGVVFVYVVNAAQTKMVLFGENGAVEAAKPGTVFVLCVTMQPSEMESIAQQLTDAGMIAIDAPVSGGAAKAASGDISMMTSGSPDAMESIKPALDAISAKVFRLGDTPGMGSRVKTINQLLAGVHIAATAEAMVMGAKMDIDLRTLYEVITECAGNSWMFENRGEHIVEGDYTPYSAVDIFVKDLGIVVDEAEAIDCETPLSLQALSLFKEAANAGLGREDDSAVAKVLASKSNVQLPGHNL